MVIPQVIYLGTRLHLTELSPIGLYVCYMAYVPHCVVYRSDRVRFPAIDCSRETL